ncbi:MAG TPA: winged helix DNA-binding protein [Alphaproteobacteria bacterium]|nr:winged helix DNA-binding protein [Alphaproteobacteria bacterium]
MKVEKELEEMGLYQQTHLSQEDETAFIEFEFALHHIMEAFGRWSTELHEHVSGRVMPVQDVSMLQIIRMKDTPKSATEIAKYLNRTDSANVLYGLRKLEKLGLIEKSPGPPRETTYQVTEEGRGITDRYAAKRRELLLSLIDRMSQSGSMFEGVNRALWLMSGLYEQAARTVSVISCLSDAGAAPTVLTLPGKPRKNTRAARSDAPVRARKAAS